MKRKLLAAGFVIAGILAFAGTCTVQHINLTTIGSQKIFAGEVHNDSGADFLQHRVRVAFFDSNNNLLDEKVVTPCLRSLPNGEADFFSAASSSSSGSVKAAIARLEYGTTLKGGTPDIGSGTITNITVTRDGTSLRVQGTLKNTDSTKLEAPNVCAVVYDSTDDVVLVGLDESLSDLIQNGTDTFDITLTVVDSTSTTDHVDIWADGMHGNTPVEAISSTGRDVTLATATPTPTITKTPTVTVTPTKTPTATPTP